MLELTMLPARQGDALWIRWGNAESPHQMIIDMGTEEVGNNIRQLLEELDETQREFELLVVTHVDRDHIGGILTCLADASPIDKLNFKDVWFNGWTHLNGGQVSQPASGGGSGTGSGLESFGPADAERFTKWLREQPWNEAFDGKQVSREPGNSPPKVTLADGLTLSVLGPTPERLTGFIPKWKYEVAEALRKGNLDSDSVSPGLEAYGSKTPPDLILPEDLEALAESSGSVDPSEANGSSISLLLEYRGRRIVLAGDAFGSDVANGLAKLSPQGALEVDAVKLPHHGSKNNVSRALVEAVTCPNWLFSTDGTQFRHPDSISIARVISYSSNKPTLFFNVPSTYNEWWCNPKWKKMYKYKTEYGNANDGITIDFPIDDS